jgi:hypothetical protein
MDSLGLGFLPREFDISAVVLSSLPRHAALALVAWIEARQTLLRPLHPAASFDRYE